MMLRSSFLIVFLFAFSSSVLAATALDDNYDADNVPSSFGGECSGPNADFSYNLQPDPFANDAFTSINNIINLNVVTVEAPQSGFFTGFVDQQTGTVSFFYDNSCAAPGSFTFPVVGTYTYEDAGDPNAGPTTGTITVNPPSLPAAANDTYEAVNLPQTPGPGTGQTTYSLGTLPFDNDNITPSVDLDRTVRDPNNFTKVSGPGTFISGLDPQTNEILLNLVIDDVIPFDTAVVINYYLSDSQGPISGTDATITINPPPSAEANDDNYDANTLTAVNVQGNIGYILSPLPFANDVITPEVSLQETIAQQVNGNFGSDGGDGTLQVVDDPQNGPVFTYFPGTSGSSLFTYHLYDAQGNQLTTDVGGILITDPSTQPMTTSDEISGDSLETISGPGTGETTYRLGQDPLDNDNLSAPYDQAATFAATDNFVLRGSSGRFVARLDQNTRIYEYITSQPFTTAVVVDYNLRDAQGAVIPNTNATITISPPSTQPPPPPPTQRLSNIEEACAFERANQTTVPEFCDNNIVSASERMLILSTISAQADALFGMQSDQIANIRQRMSENRGVYNPASVAGLNGTILGKSVPIGRIAQELMKPLSGGGAADDDFLNSGRLGFFLNGSFSAGDRDETGLTGGYDSDGYNLTSGLDYRVSLNFIIGAALGIASEDTDFAANRGDQTADTTSLSFYGNYFPSDSFYADYLFMLTSGDLDVNRNTRVNNEIAVSDTKGDLWSFAGTLGYHWNVEAWEFDGYGRVEYTDLTIDAYSEQASIFALSVDEQEAQSLEAALGFKVARVFSLRSGVVIPSLDLEYLNQFEDDTRFIGVDMSGLSNGFMVQDEAADSNYFNAALSLSSVFASGFSGYLRIESQLGDEHLGRTQYSGGLRWEF